MAPLALPGPLRRTVGGLPRTYWWLWTNTLVTSLGGFVVPFMTPYLTEGLGHSSAYAGLVITLFGLGSAVSAVAGGVLADRVGRRPTLVGAQLATGVAILALGLARHPALIAALAFTVGLTSNATRPARAAIMADLVAPADRVRAYSLNYWGINLGFAAASVLAGIMAEHDFALLFPMNAVAAVVCALIVLARVPETLPGPTTVGAAPTGGGGLRRVLSDRALLAFLSASFLVSLVFQQQPVALPVAMAADGHGSGTYGAVIAVNGLLIALLQLPLTRWLEGRDEVRVLIVSSLLVGVGFGLTGLVDGVWAYALTVAVWTVGEMANAPAANSVVAALSPTDLRGRYQGLYTLSWSAASCLAPGTAGLVLTHLGESWLWSTCVLAGVASAATFLAVGARVRTASRSRRGPVPDPAPAPTGTGPDGPGGPGRPERPELTTTGTG